MIIRCVMLFPLIPHFANSYILILLCSLLGPFTIFVAFYSDIDLYYRIFPLTFFAQVIQEEEGVILFLGAGPVGVN